MSARALESHAPTRDRTPAVAAAVLGGMTAQPLSAARALQTRIGNQGVLAMLAQEAGYAPTHTFAPEPSSSAASSPDLRVSSPNDTAEREATTTAAAVTRMADPTPIRATAPGVHRAEAPKAASPAGGKASTAVSAGIAASMGGGTPLAPAVRAYMEPRFHADFSRVRVHNDPGAAGLSEQLHAKAFTVGSHIFFGAHQYQPDRPEGRELLAHELTHTVQQGGAVQRTIQREGDDTGGYFASLSADGLARMAVHSIAPSLEPLMAGAGGVVAWLESKATAAFEIVVSTLMAPAKAFAGAGAELQAVFGPMLAALQVAAGQIAQNDCSPLREAADKLEKTAVKLITPIVEKVQPIVAAIKEFLNSVWDKIGAPVWDWIKQYAAAQWQAIKDIASLVSRAAKWLWDKTSSIRAVYAAAWKWLKDKLGIGEGPEGEDGILQWVQRKLTAVWDVVKARLAPFTNQIKAVAATVGGVLLALSPAGPVIAVGAAVAGAVQGLRWLYANWGKGNIIATARVYIQKTLIPPLVAAAQRLGAAVSGAAHAISTALNNLAASLQASVGALGGSLLAFAVSAVQWLAQQAEALAAWANGQLSQAGAWLTGALNGLQNFLNNVLLFLSRVADIVIDVWGLPVLLGEAIWNRIPACIRDPIVDFLGPIILGQIEIFQELTKDDDAWQKTKAEVGKIIKLVFHDHDLMGAVKAVFFLILRVFNLPPDLLVTIGRKALAAWDVVIKKPLDFIKNTVRSLGHGFKLLWADKIGNLKLGLQGWLLGEIKEKNIVVPTDWGEPKQLFNFVLSVLGISAEHVYELLKKRFPDSKAIDRIRSVIGKAASVIEWVDKAIDSTKSPAENAKGMVDQAKGFGIGILTGIAEWVAGRVAAEIAAMAVAAAASAGLSEVVDIARRIYKAILTAVRWANRIAMMVNDALDNVLDIAAGSIEKVGGVFLKLMQMAMPVVIGFLADQVGLGGVGSAIRGIVDKLRAEVDKAILWVIDKIKAGLDALIRMVKAGVKALTDWWKERRPFTGADGRPHAVYFRGSQDSAEVIVESTPILISTYLTRVLADQKLKAVHGKAQVALDNYNTNIKPYLKSAADEQRKQSLPDHLTKLSEQLREIVGMEDADAPATTRTHQAPAYSAMDYISEKTLKKGADKATGSTQEMDLVTVYAPKNKSGATSWVRMHMITHQVGGAPTAENWVPAPSAVNTGRTVRAFEENVEALVRKDKGPTGKTNVIWVRAEATEFHSKFDGPPKRYRYGASKFPSSVSFEAGLYIPEVGNKWTKAKASLTSRAVIPPPKSEFTGDVPDVNTASPAQLMTATETSEWFINQVIEARQKHGKMKNSDQLEKHLEDNRDRETVKFKQFMSTFRAAEAAKEIVFA